MAARGAVPDPESVVDVERELIREVDLAFGVTGAATPGWPDPHPDRPPLQEEYSRVTDVGKYRILGTRVDAWVEVLESRKLADVAEVATSPWIGLDRPPLDSWRRRRITPTRSGGLALLIADTLVDGSPFGLEIGLASGDERPVFLDLLPVCGCDACDSGSADLLDALDGWVVTTARGGVVHVRRGQDCVTRTRAGWQGSFRGDPSWLDESLATPPGVERWVGVPWV